MTERKHFVVAVQEGTCQVPWDLATRQVCCFKLHDKKIVTEIEHDSAA